MPWDQNEIQVAILGLVNEYYPGGTEQAEKDGVQIAPAPLSDEELNLIFYHPNIGSLTSDFVNALQAFKEATGVPVILTDTLNFDKMSNEQINDQVGPAAREISQKYNLKDKILVKSNPLIALFIIPFALTNEQDASSADRDMFPLITPEGCEDIKNILMTKVKGLMRGLLIIGSKIFYFSQEPKFKRSIEPEQEKGNITDDYLMDLKIILNQNMDVSDIINNL